MSKFKGRNKRWNKSIRKARWKTHKREMLTKGWVEVGLNTLVPKDQGLDYPLYTPTHLGGKPEKGKNISLYKNQSGLPRRSIARRLKRVAKANGMTFRQFISGDWS